MSIRKLGDTVTLRFGTFSPSTRLAKDADSTPTCQVFQGGNDTPILSPTPTKVATGDYKVDIAATGGNGFAVGQSYNVKLSATVEGVAQFLYWSFLLDGKRVADLNDLAAGAAMTLTGAYDPAKTAATQASVNAIPTNPLITNDVRLNHLDADISSRLAAAAYVAPDNADIGAIKVKTDTLPADPASTAQVQAAITAAFTEIKGAGWTNETLKGIFDALAGAGITAQEIWEYATRGLTDKDGFELATDQAVNVAKVGGAAVTGPGDLKADVSALALEATAQAIKGKVDAHDVYLLRLLGLSHENTFIDQITYNANGRRTGARLRSYSAAGSVGTDNDVLASYAVTVTWDANGRLETYQVVKS